MCGIAAVLTPGSTPPEAMLQRMKATLRHRGPDAESVDAFGPAALIHTRLAIIDVAGGHQPFRSEDGMLHAIVNGEIYNHVALRDELESLGHAFSTRSDCEVVLHGFEQWGVDVFRRLNGIFASALWDRRNEQLVLVRDPFGVKPLYWWSDGTRYAAASELATLLETGWIDRALDAIALDHFLAWRFVPSPRTLFAGISKLAPATALIIADGGHRLVSYRSPPGPLLDRATAADLAPAIARTFEEAVARQMMSDVPTGAFLSGGLDSAAIVAAMARQLPDGRPKTFTVGFPGHGDELDERAPAAAHAAAIGADHAAMAMEMEDYLGALARSVRSVEEPCGTASAPAAMELCRFAASRVKVVLSGQGADEPWGGYQRHQAAALLGLVDAVPGIARRPLQVVARALPRNERAKRAAALLDAPAGDQRLLSIFDITTAELRAALTRSDGTDAAAERAALAATVLADVGDRDPLDQALYLDTHLFLPDQLLIWGDKTSMASGLEQRVPFLDHELMALVERIPARLRMRGARRKWLYRRAMARLVPPAVLRQRKHPFATPYDDWLRAELGAEVARRYAPGEPLADVIDGATVGALVAEHRTGRADHKRVLYALLELSQWHHEFIEQRPTTVAP